MKTLYISDLDGTLLNDDAQVSARSAEIISSLSHRGVLISVATARTPATVVPLLEHTYTAADLVVMTGAALWDRPAARFRELKLIPANDVETMLHIFARHSLCPFCYLLGSEGHIDVYHAAPALTAAEEKFVNLRRNLALKTFHLSTPAPADAPGRTILFFAMGSKDSIVAVAEKLRDATDCYVSYYKDTYLPDLWLLEVFGPGVSKADGIRLLRSRLGADRVVVFGDNLNDIPMMQVADVAVAVENALPEVKAIADVVIGSNNDDSVARFILENER